MALLPANAITEYYWTRTIVQELFGTYLAGGRFLIPYLRDVGDAHQIFCEFIKKKRLAVLDGEAEDYNTNPQPSGYRGLHQGLLAVVN
jgi:ppGpp synthetase/RelA/SpoT-type nucleotidyltranferase